ncbi:hypothetical protein [Thauera sp. WH-1]|uniref:hypothetical protein n=1 Tax=Thauera sp. WH-1 TaxID=3398230 RepID=UPI0039FDC94B
MVSFVRGQTIKTATPTITVDAGLAAGVHRFQLVVQTDTGQASVPAMVEVSVVRMVVDPIRPVLDSTVVNPPPGSPTLTTTPTVTTNPTPTGSIGGMLVRPRAAPSRKPRKSRKES